MEPTPKTPDKPNYLSFNRYAYAFLLLTGIVLLFLTEGIQGAIFINLSVVFDFFNPLQAWSLSPVWQGTWLTMHLTEGIGALKFMLI